MKFQMKDRSGKKAMSKAFSTFIHFLKYSKQQLRGEEGTQAR